MRLFFFRHHAVRFGAVYTFWESYGAVRCGFTFSEYYGAIRCRFFSSRCEFRIFNYMIRCGSVGLKKKIIRCDRAVRCVALLFGFGAFCLRCGVLAMLCVCVAFCLRCCVLALRCVCGALRCGAFAVSLRCVCGAVRCGAEPRGYPYDSCFPGCVRACTVTPLKSRGFHCVPQVRTVQAKP